MGRLGDLWITTSDIYFKNSSNGDNVWLHLTTTASVQHPHDNELQLTWYYRGHFKYLKPISRNTETARWKACE